jgi:hypothetical protein
VHAKNNALCYSRLAPLLNAGKQRYADRKISSVLLQISSRFAGSIFLHVGFVQSGHGHPGIWTLLLDGILLSDRCALHCSEKGNKGNMNRTHLNFAILIGFILVMIGFIIPMSIILKYVLSSFVLNFLAYACSVVGLMMGIVGVAKCKDLNKDGKNIH